MSGLRLLTLFAWTLLIRALSRLPGLSARRRDKLKRSALKRTHRVLAQLEILTEGSAAPVPIDGPENTPKPAVTRQTAQLDLDPEKAAYRILVVCLHSPTLSHAGGLRILDMLRMIKARVPNASIELFLPNNKELYGPIDLAIALADKITLAEDYNFSLLELRRRHAGPLPFFDVVDFQFPQPIEVIQQYRKIADKLIFTPMESLIRNELITRQEEAGAGIALNNKDAILEQQIAQTVDLTVCVSEMDRAAVASYVQAPVTAIETGISEIEFSRDMQPCNVIARNVCYVAYFGSETNRAALSWYLEHVHPKVLDAVPDYVFSIIGRGDISDLLDPLAQGINYIGEVERIGPYLKGGTLGIAPALSGSGFRGKINQYAFMGLPTVASPLSANGLAYEDGISIRVGETPEAFAQAVIDLLLDDQMRTHMAQQALDVTQTHYTWETKWPAIAEAYDLPKTPAAVADLSGAAPTVHAIVPSYQHGRFIEERIRSIFAQEYPGIRVTVIDDHSQDDSDAVIRALQTEFDFTYIRRDQNSGTPFSAWEYAANNTHEDLIWICESDDVADSMLVPKLVKAMKARQGTKIAYCGSIVIDDVGTQIGTTHDFHSRNFHPNRWQRTFIARGHQELLGYGRFGMIVPNMSSALFDRETFCKAFTPNIKDYRLAGDWLFLGQALQFGDIVFVPEPLNRFRQHEQTSRHRTKEIRKIAEYASVRQILTYLSNPSEDAYLDAVKHDLNALHLDANLTEPVLEELAGFDPWGAETFSGLIEKHLDKGLASAALTDALARRAPLPSENGA